MLWKKRGRKTWKEGRGVKQGQQYNILWETDIMGFVILFCLLSCMFHNTLKDKNRRKKWVL